MDDAQATAKWANRVLRPLTSICRRIAKHKETLSMIATESKLQETAEGNDAPKLEAKYKPESQHNCSGSDADPDENDPAWIPGKKPERRRPRLKYSSKAEDGGGKRRNRLSIHSPEAPRILPGAIEVATPLITGRRWEMPSSAQSERAEGYVNPNIQQSQPLVFRDRYSLHKSPWQELLDQSGDPGFADIAHNLDRVFQNFLCNTVISKRETKPLSENSRRGARSLLSMVTRSLPKFIAREQEAQDELDEDGDEEEFRKDLSRRLRCSGFPIGTIVEVGLEQVSTEMQTCSFKHAPLAPGSEGTRGGRQSMGVDVGNGMKL